MSPWKSWTKGSAGSDTWSENEMEHTDSEKFASEFQKQVGAFGLTPEKGPVLVGVSGGVDSMVLLDLLVKTKHAVHVAHVNYGLRGRASAADQHLVEAKAREYGCALSTMRVDLKRNAVDSGESIQAVARRIRYNFFSAIAENRAISFVAVGHHRDDQIETILLNMFRGAGARGLAGLPRSRMLREDRKAVLIRPLLSFSRSDLVAYAGKRRLTWHEDASNESRKYARNAIRHDVLPAIKATFGDKAIDRLLRIGQQMARVASLERYASRRVIKAVEEGCVVSIEALVSAPVPLRGRIVLDALARISPTAPVSSAVAQQILSLMSLQAGRKAEIENVVVWRGRSRLLFIRKASSPSGNGAKLLEIPGEVEVGRGRLLAERIETHPDWSQVSANEIYADADALGSKVGVRRWRPGDRMSLPGLHGTKKVADILTDEKVGVAIRSRAMVIEAQGGILWLVGVRRSAIASITPDTRRIIRVAYEAFENVDKVTEV